MKQSLVASFLALAVSVVAACGGPNPAVGIYEIDKASFKAGMLAMMPAETKGKPEAVAMVDNMAKELVASIELKADGSLVSAMQMSMLGTKIDEPGTGTWKLDGQKLTLTMKSNREGAKEETKVVDYANHGFSVDLDQGGQKLKMAFVKK